MLAYVIVDWSITSGRAGRCSARMVPESRDQRAEVCFLAPLLAGVLPVEWGSRPSRIMWIFEGGNLLVRTVLVDFSFRLVSIQ